MDGDLYEVCCYDTNVLATGMTLDIAMILAEALFNKWYAEPDLAIEIKRMPRTQEKEADYERKEQKHD